MFFPLEKFGIKFYNYYFYEIDKPIIIEARNKKESRLILGNIISKLPEKYRQSKIIGETITVPLIGVSKKKVNGQTLIWVGEDKGNKGWISEQDFRNL